MSEFNRSKIVSRFMPTLLHLANVKIAVIILNKFSEETLQQIFDTPQKECKQEFQETSEKVLELLPEDLRDGVDKACYGLRKVVQIWHLSYQSELGLTKRDWVSYWRSNGMIDVGKTVQSLVLNVNIDIIIRFHLACQYCMEENIMNLWSEMKTSGKTKCLNLKRHPISEFWACWIRDGCQVPWGQSFPGFLHNRRDSHFIARFSAYLPLLPLEERMGFLKFLKKTDDDDYLHYLYAATKEEQDQILKQDPLKLLIAYSNWPFQGLLMETAHKMWSYLSEDYVRDFIRMFFLRKENSKDFAYGQLFLQLWNKIPVSFKATAKKDLIVKKNILVWLGFAKKGRKKKVNEEPNKRTSGLLQFTRWKFRTSNGLLRKKIKHKPDRIKN